MSLQFNLSTKNFSRNVGSIVGVISDSLLSPFIKDEAIISQEASIVLKNPLDREIVDSAVQEMKNNRQITSKTITLSNNRKITLSID